MASDHQKKLLWLFFAISIIGCIIWLRGVVIEAHSLYYKDNNGIQSLLRKRKIDISKNLGSVILMTYVAICGIGLYWIGLD